MPISRRNLLRRLGTTALTGAAVDALGGLPVPERPQPAHRASEIAQTVFLDHNENAYGPSEKVLAVLRDASLRSSRYPRAEYDSLLTKLAALHAVKKEQIVLGCGSSELLRATALTFLGPGKKLVQASPTYPALGKFARLFGAEVVEVPVTKRYEHDLNTMLARGDDSVSLAYICNPNNPTATLTARQDIEGFIHKLPAKAVVLIDEAYHHFVTPNSSYTSFLDQPFDDPRVIVCRTFSKVYGLAGMRIGYAVAAPELAQRLSANRLQFGISVIAAKAADAALEDTEYVRLAVKRNADDRQEFMNSVNVRMLRAIDSHTNFVMLNPMRPSEQVIEHLKKNNVLVAPRIPAMDSYIRVSLGTPAEMREFWRVWDLMPPTGKMAM
jgi:histidinol-phosphate aminotransferase